MTGIGPVEVSVPRVRATGLAAPTIASAFLRRSCRPMALEKPRSRRPAASREATIADAILDRIVHNAHRISLEGDSMRKRTTPHLTDAQNSKTNPT